VRRGAAQMTANSLTDEATIRMPAGKALAHATRFWVVVAVIGQLIFAYYIAVLYGGAALRGDLAGWGKVMPRGYIAGDSIGNIVIGTHLLLAFFLSTGGALQLIPQLRTHAPAFHRWNGRIFASSALIASIGGLYLLWIRGTVGDTSQHLGTTFNAILIIFCVVMAWRFALVRNVGMHRRWALRLFLVVAGVWFFRVGLMLWLLIHQAPVGFDAKSFTGPFLTFLTFAQTLLPLAVLELYFYVQDHGRERARVAMAITLIVLTLAMAAGIFAATMGMWLSHLH
jgi:Predicted membrane protein (DUF2306)